MASDQSPITPAAKDGWVGIKTRFFTKPKEEVNKHLWDSAAPELVIEFCRHQLGSFGKLKSKLSNCSADWIEGFLDHDGLVLIFDSLDAFSKNELGSFMDAVKQLECIQCLRALMNHGECLRHIINCENTQDRFADQISRSLDTENSLLKIQILELLSAMCVYSYDGYETTIRTLEQVQNLRMLPYTFSSIVNELQREVQIEYSTTLITFINCLIVSLEDLEERNEVRQEFIALGLADILDKLRHTENENLQAQLESFRDVHNHDLDLLDEEVSRLAIDIESPDELVTCIKKKMIGTQRINHFVHILQSLLLLEQSSNSQNGENWRQLDNILTSVIISAISSDELTEFEEKSLLKKALKDCLSDLKIQDQNVGQLVTTNQPLKSDSHTQTDAIIKKFKHGITQTEVAYTPQIATTTNVQPKSETAQNLTNITVVPENYSYPTPPPDLPEVEEAIQKLVPQPPPNMPGAGVSEGPSNIPVPPPSMPGVEETPSGDNRIPRPPPNMPGVCGGEQSGDPRIPIPPPNIPGVQGVDVGKLSTGKLAPAISQKPSKKMRTLKWDKITEKDIQKKTGTLWNELDLSLFTLDSKTINIVEENYAIKEIKQANVAKAQERKEKTSFLDQRTSMNISIFLKQFKNQNLSKIISDGDESKISLEQMKAFSKILPDTAVAKQIKSYEGDMAELADADKFFYDFFKLENYEMRVQVLTVKLDYKSEYEELNPNLTKLEKTSSEIIQNVSLKKVMGILLSLGNFINHGSYAGSAAGFKISSLNKLNDTRANKPRMTFLNSLVEIVEEKFPDVRTFGSSMPLLEGSLRLSVDQLTDSVKALKTKIDQTCRKRLNCADDLKEQIETFLNIVTSQLEELERQGKNVLTTSAQICNFFAEDPKLFKLEDFMKTLHQFCKDFDKALTENTNRKEAEARKKRIEEKKKEVKPNLRGLGAANTGKPQEDGDIIDRLMGEIKRGMTLKNVTACRENSVATDGLSAPSERRRRVSQRRRLSNAASLRHMSMTSQDGSSEIGSGANADTPKSPKSSNTNPKLSASSTQPKTNSDRVSTPDVELSKDFTPKTIPEPNESINAQQETNSQTDPLGICVNSSEAIPTEKENTPKKKWGFRKQKENVKKEIKTGKK